MLIGGDDISYDVITLARVFNVCASRWLRKSDSSVDGESQGNWRWKLSFLFPPRRQRACSQGRGGVVPVQLFPDPCHHRLFCSVTQQALNWLLQSNLVSIALLDSKGKTLRTRMRDVEAVLIFFPRLVLIFMLPVFARWSGLFIFPLHRRLISNKRSRVTVLRNKSGDKMWINYPGRAF